MVPKFQILKLSDEYTNFSVNVTEVTFNTLEILIFFWVFFPYLDPRSCYPVIFRCLPFLPLK